MNKVMIEVKYIRAASFIESDPVEVKVWLILMAHCTVCENGGRLAGASKWTDDQWAINAGVPGAIMRKKTALWEHRGGDVFVAFYSMESEETYQAIAIRNRDAINSRWKKVKTKINGNHVQSK